MNRENNVRVFIWKIKYVYDIVGKNCVRLNKAKVHVKHTFVAILYYTYNNIWDLLNST